MVPPYEVRGTAIPLGDVLNRLRADPCAGVLAGEKGAVSLAAGGVRRGVVYDQSDGLGVGAAGRDSDQGES